VLHEGHRDYPFRGQQAFALNVDARNNSWSAGTARREEASVQQLMTRRFGHTSFVGSKPYSRHTCSNRRARAGSARKHLCSAGAISSDTDPGGRSVPSPRSVKSRSTLFCRCSSRIVRSWEPRQK